MSTDPPSIGKGIKIAVVDTGVDYFHPALGKGYGPGRKISFGKDFIGVSLSHICFECSDHRRTNMMRPVSLLLMMIR